MLPGIFVPKILPYLEHLSSSVNRDPLAQTYSLDNYGDASVLLIGSAAIATLPRAVVYFANIIGIDPCHPKLLAYAGANSDAISRFDLSDGEAVLIGRADPDDDYIGYLPPLPPIAGNPQRFRFIMGEGRVLEAAPIVTGKAPTSVEFNEWSFGRGWSSFGAVDGDWEVGQALKDVARDALATALGMR